MTSEIAQLTEQLKNKKTELYSDYLDGLPIKGTKAYEDEQALMRENILKDRND